MYYSITTYKLYLGSLEAEKDRTSGALKVQIVPRPSDAFKAFEFPGGSAPFGLESVGSDCKWNKRSSPKSIRRNSIELFEGITGTQESTTKALEQQQIAKAALDSISAGTNN